MTEGSLGAKCSVMRFPKEELGVGVFRGELKVVFVFRNCLELLWFTLLLADSFSCCSWRVYLGSEVSGGWSGMCCKEH